MDHLQSEQIADEQQIAAELDLSSFIASLADDRLITSVITRVARRSVMANVNTEIVKPGISVNGTTYKLQFTLEFPSGSPLLLVEVGVDTLASNAVVVALNGQQFAGTTTNLCVRPFVWVPPSTRLDVFATNGSVVAHATGLQLHL
jgi:hypothetical protein